MYPAAWVSTLGELGNMASGSVCVSRPLFTCLSRWVDHIIVHSGYTLSLHTNTHAFPSDQGY